MSDTSITPSLDTEKCVARSIARAFTDHLTAEQWTELRRPQALVKLENKQADIAERGMAPDSALDDRVSEAQAKARQAHCSAVAAVWSRLLDTTAEWRLTNALQFCGLPVGDDLSAVFGLSKHADVSLVLDKIAEAVSIATNAARRF